MCLSNTGISWLGHASRVSTCGDLGQVRHVDPASSPAFIEQLKLFQILSQLSARYWLLSICDPKLKRIQRFTLQSSRVRSSSTTNHTMASNTRLVAHKRQHSSGPIPSAVKRACIMRPGDLPTRTLMNLPIEVRLLILRRALWQSEPLRFVKHWTKF
jgi:hypothetical protein